MGSGGLRLGGDRLGSATGSGRLPARRRPPAAALGLGVRAGSGSATARRRPPARAPRRRRRAAPRRRARRDPAPARPRPRRRRRRARARRSAPARPRPPAPPATGSGSAAAGSATASASSAMAATAARPSTDLGRDGSGATSATASGSAKPRPRRPPRLGLRVDGAREGRGGEGRVPLLLLLGRDLRLVGGDRVLDALARGDAVDPGLDRRVVEHHELVAGIGLRTRLGLGRGELARPSAMPRGWCRPRRRARLRHAASASVVVGRAPRRPWRRRPARRRRPPRPASGPRSTSGQRIDPGSAATPSWTCAPFPLGANAIAGTTSSCASFSMPGSGTQVRQRPSAVFQQLPHVYWRQVRQKLKVLWNASSWFVVALRSSSLRASAIASEKDALVRQDEVASCPLRDRAHPADPRAPRRRRLERVASAAPFAERLGEDLRHQLPRAKDRARPAACPGKGQSIGPCSSESRRRGTGPLGTFVRSGVAAGRTGPIRRLWYGCARDGRACRSRTASSNASSSAPTARLFRTTAQPRSRSVRRVERAMERARTGHGDAHGRARRATASASSPTTSTRCPGERRTGGARGPPRRRRARRSPGRTATTSPAARRLARRRPVASTSGPVEVDAVGGAGSRRPARPRAAPSRTSPVPRPPGRGAAPCTTLRPSRPAPDAEPDRRRRSSPTATCVSRAPVAGARRRPTRAGSAATAPRPSSSAGRPRPPPARAPRLVAATAPSATIEVDGTPLTLGRATDNGLVLADTRVSRQHARLQARRGTLVFTDLGSTNGSARQRRPGRRVRARDGRPRPGRRHGPRSSSSCRAEPRGRLRADAVAGQAPVPARPLRVPVRGGAGPAARPARRVARPDGARAGSWSSRRRRGEPQPGGSYPLDAVTTLGRDVNNGDRRSTTRSPPRDHAVLTYRGRSWYVEDLESTNGTFVNGVPVERRRPARVRRRAPGGRGPVPARPGSRVSAAAQARPARQPFRIRPRPRPTELGAARASSPPRWSSARPRSGRPSATAAAIEAGAPADGPRLLAARPARPARVPRRARARAPRCSCSPAGAPTRSCCPPSGCSAGSGCCSCSACPRTRVVQSLRVAGARARPAPARLAPHRARRDRGARDRRPLRRLAADLQVHVGGRRHRAAAGDVRVRHRRQRRPPDALDRAAVRPALGAAEGDPRRVPGGLPVARTGRCSRTRAPASGRSGCRRSRTSRRWS